MNTPTKYRILFIDDDEILLQSLKNYFSRIGHEVFGATTGKEGIEAFGLYRPDVAVVDLNLPDISGIDVLSELKKRKAMVIMLTGMGDVENAVEAMRLHAENFLTKPVEMSHLAVAVEKAAEKATLRRENVELKAKLSPSFNRLMMKVGAFIVLVAVSAIIGMAIGSGEAVDPREQGPIPVPIIESPSG
jgi:DNA-binding NtrC family response regulator